jgi:Flp pilus assembly protein TadG
MTRKRLLKPWFRKLRFDRFAADERGVAAVEFAAVLPVVLILLLGCFEVPRFVLTYQKLARTAHSVADLVSQADEPMTLPQLQDVFVAAKMIMAPYDIIGAGKVFVSSINNPSGTVSITWQKSNDSTLTSLKSRIGTVGGAPTLPAGLSPKTGDEVLVAEVFYNYKPVIGTLIYKGSQLYSVSYSRPRNKNLMTAPK